MIMVSRMVHYTLYSALYRNKHTHTVTGSLVVWQEVLAFGLARVLGMCLELHPTCVCMCMSVCV